VVALLREAAENLDALVIMIVLESSCVSIIDAVKGRRARVVMILIVRVMIFVSIICV
jgi:hypothetical protein